MNFEIQRHLTKVIVDIQKRYGHYSYFDRVLAEEIAEQYLLPKVDISAKYFLYPVSLFAFGILCGMMIVWLF